MRIGWKAYLRSGQVIEFTADHDSDANFMDGRISFTPYGSKPYVQIRARSIEAITHDAFKLAGYEKTDKVTYDAAMLEDIIGARYGGRFKNIKPNQEGDGSYTLSWPDHVTARC